MNTKKGFLLVIILFIIASLSGVNNYAASKYLLPGGDEYLAFCEEMPSIIGGMPALAKYVSYPSVAKQTRIEGKVYLLAFINEKGGVDDVKVVKGIGGGCDEAAINAVKKCKFNPGKHKGSNCKVKLSLAINFKL
jgi:protein TonB